MKPLALIRKLHIYAGLLTLSQLAVYGIAGLVTTIQAGRERSQIPHSMRMVPFHVPASSTDKQVARLVYDTLRPPLSRPMPDWFLQHTPDNHLRLDFYNINGIHRVTVLEEENQLRVEEIRLGLPRFLGDIHASTPGDEDAPALVRSWAFWNELAMWSLLGFCVSGTWLWLATRPRFWWAWAALATSVCGFAALWARFRA